MPTESQTDNREHGKLPKEQEPWRRMVAATAGQEGDVEKMLGRGEVTMKWSSHEEKRNDSAVATQCELT